MNDKFPENLQNWYESKMEKCKDEFDKAFINTVLFGESAIHLSENGKVRSLNIEEINKLKDKL